MEILYFICQLKVFSSRYIFMNILMGSSENLFRSLHNLNQCSMSDNLVVNNVMSNSKSALFNYHQ